MAVRRDKIDLNLRQSGAGALLGYQGTPNPVQLQPEGPGIADMALEGILSIGKSIGVQSFEADVKQAYVHGQLERQRGAAVESMDVDPLMAPFARGGYNDQDYRIKAVEFEQDFDQWLKTEGRTLSPDDPKLKEYLDRGNQQVLGLVTPGMTRGAQLTALSGQVEANAARVAKHYSEHRKYLIEEFSRRVTPEGNQIISELAEATLSQDATTYDALTRKAVSYYTGLMASNDAPAEFKQEVGNKFLHALLSSDQRIPVEVLQDSGFLDTMPFEDREKLTNAIRESENRTRNQEFAGKVAAFAQIEDAGTSGEMPIEQFADHVQRAVANKHYTPARGIALLREAMTKGVGDRENTQAILAAVNARQLDGPDGVYALAGGPEQALGKVDLLLRKSGMPTIDRVSTITKAGLDFGVIPKAHGESIGHAIRAIASAKDTDTIAPEHVALVNSVLSIVDVASKAEPAKAGVLLQAMPEDVRGAMSYVISQAKNGIAPKDSLTKYWADVDSVKQQTPAQRARTTQKWWDEHKSVITGGGGFDTGWFGDYIKGDTFTETAIKDAVWAELRTMDDNPAYWGGSEEDKVRVATAQVMARTIPVPTAPGESNLRPVILDPNSNMTALFDADGKAVGNALAELATPVKEGNTSILRWDRVNKAFVQAEITPEGQSFIVQSITPDKVKEKIGNARQVLFESRQRDLFGDAVETPAGTIFLDGRNGAGEAKSTVRAARELIHRADPGKVSAIVERNPSGAQSVFREDTDVAVAQARRFVAKHYTLPQARSAVIAAVYLEGADKVQQVLEAADAAHLAGDAAAFNEALSLINNETVRERLREAIPIANPENRMKSLQ